MNIYNIIILDKSGSMEEIKQEAINGYNETLQSIISAQTKHAEQRHFVTLVTFDSDSTDTVYDRVEAAKAEKLTTKTYQPGTMTPLYDAMGVTLTKFRNSLDASVESRILVTIITDGQENASKEFSGKQIHKIVTDLKAEGWVFTYIGANQNVEEVAKTIAITNILNFESSKSGTTQMFKKQMKSRARWFDKVAENLSIQKLQEDFFEEDE